MLEIVTESGAVYRYDPVGEKVTRLGGPKVVDRIWADAVWENMTPVTDIQLDYPIVWAHRDRDSLRKTTAVVSITTVGEEN